MRSELSTAKTILRKQSPPIWDMIRDINYHFNSKVITGKDDLKGDSQHM